MPGVEKKYHVKGNALMRDTRSSTTKFFQSIAQPQNATVALGATGGLLLGTSLLQDLDVMARIADVLFFIGLLYFRWIMKQKFGIPLKMPSFMKRKNADKKKPDGILFLGNESDDKTEMWVSNSDARTHILFFGTTGAGKTEGLKSLVTNAMTWGSGFIYIDGKADTNLWASLYALARRFGRDDDLLVLNYMTANSDMPAMSNTMNPFSSGSASYLTNMMVSLMPEVQGDNAMWKERAVALMGAMMPALTWKRDNQGVLLDVGVVRDHLSLPAIIKLSRDQELPERLRRALHGYLDTLPGYVDEAYDDEGNQKPAGPGEPMMDMSTPSQQHGYLSMQFTRSLGSLADDYGYIFNIQLADIDMTDVVLNRRLLVVLIPALEKSGDEAANLGKIAVASLKGMMGSTLGNSVEGQWGSVIENKPTNASTPFMTVFDEVGYYTVSGMGVMAAQARSLGFSLIFAAQDMAAMEKRIKEEAYSIAANCNLKIFGKIEDPRSTREFFEKSVNNIKIAETKSYAFSDGTFGGYNLKDEATSVSSITAFGYSDLKKLKQGEIILLFNGSSWAANIFYSDPKKVKALRVQHYLRISPNDVRVQPSSPTIDQLDRNMHNPRWSVAASGPETPENEIIETLISGFQAGQKAGEGALTCGALSVASVSHMIHKKAEEHAGTEKPGIEDALAEASANLAAETPAGSLSWADIMGAAMKDEPKPVLEGGPLNWAELLGASMDDADTDEETGEDETETGDAPAPKENAQPAPSEETPAPEDFFAAQETTEPSEKPSTSRPAEDAGLAPEIEAQLQALADMMSSELSGREEPADKTKKAREKKDET
ncbi:MAG TPA: type IV secretion protein IcmO [Rhodospirillaceae bacterium]|nr:MAG: hypothetical protein A2018_07750 [Alphaproteobacteria bacterium GWF2_58_20]HAU29193.1 type IV secretion protein IcmO [Rhodospirillaceae bacterium]